MRGLFFAADMHDWWTMRTLIALLLAVSAGTAIAQDAPGTRPGGERLTTMPLAGMVARTEQRGEVTEVEWLPAGVSFDQAMRVVNIRRIPRRAGGGGPLDFISGLAECFSPCPDQRVSAIDHTPIQGHSAARVRIDIALLTRTGRPASIHALAVSGDRYTHTITVFINGPLTPADHRFASDVLASAVFCMPGSNLLACASD